MLVTRLVTVRHAHANWTPDENRPLSESGLANAARVSSVLANTAVTAIYASPYARARQTVEPLAKDRQLEITTCGDLRERSLGRIGDASWAQASKQTWDNPEFAFPDGESNQAAKERGAATVNRLIRRHLGQCFVVASHGTLLALVFQAYDAHYGYDFWTKMSMPDVYLLTFPNPTTLSSIERLWSSEAGRE